MSGGGLCWHTSSWTPEMAIEPCDARIKPVAAYVAPVQEAAPAPVAAAPAPVEPVAAAPAPVEPVVVAAPPPPPQAISFTGDALFAFDKSELKPEGKAMLEDLISQLQGVTFDRINVTGHSDRIGSKDYNQQLSERRATTVKDYLVGKDVASGRIDAQGMGNSQPTVASDDCRNTQGSKETIACLQPDRRVDIEMTGTKMILGSR
jgi:OOP family OmpA-OmpF porin